MRATLFVLCVWLAFAPSALAQSHPVEIFGGYSVLPADRNSDFPRRTSHGIQLSVTGNLTDWFGIVGDIGFHSSTNHDVGPGFEGLIARTRVTEFLAGPRFVARTERINLFAHGLIGVVRGDAGKDFSGFSDTKPAFGGGGGIDLGIAERLAIRVQVDLFGTFADIVEGNSRFAFGLLWRAGGS